MSQDHRPPPTRRPGRTGTDRFRGWLRLAAAFLAALLLSPGLALPSARAASLTFVAGELPPYAHAGPDGAEGFAVDIANEMARRLPELKPTAITVYPFRRAFAMLANGPGTVMFGVARTAEREALAIWVAPIFYDRARFFAFGPGATLDTATAMEVEGLGVMEGTPMAAFLRDRGFTNLEPTTDPVTLARKLAMGRVQAALAPEFMMLQSMLEAGHDPSQLVPGEAVLPIDLQIAASRDVAPEVVDALRLAFADMRADGTYDRIMAAHLEPLRGYARFDTLNRRHLH